MKNSHFLLPLVLLSTVVVGQTSGQLGNPNSVQIEFNRAMTTQDGKLLHKNLSTLEQKGCTPAACSAFLAKYVKPWLSSASVVSLDGKSRATLNDPRNNVVLTFSPTGGLNYSVVDQRKVIFWTPTKLEGRRMYSTVSIAQIMFARAYELARTSDRKGLTKANFAQNLVESWIPDVQKMGFKGSVDPEFGKFQTWAEIIKASRGEIK